MLALAQTMFASSISNVNIYLRINRVKGSVYMQLTRLTKLSPEEMVALAQSSRNASLKHKVVVWFVLVILNGVPIIAKNPIRFMQGYLTSVLNQGLKNIK